MANCPILWHFWQSVLLAGQHLSRPKWPSLSHWWHLPFEFPPRLLYSSAFPDDRSHLLVLRHTSLLIEYLWPQRNKRFLGVLTICTYQWRTCHGSAHQHFPNCFRHPAINWSTVPPFSCVRLRKMCFSLGLCNYVLKWASRARNAIWYSSARSFLLLPFLDLARFRAFSGLQSRQNVKAIFFSVTVTNSFWEDITLERLFPFFSNEALAMK